MIGKTVLVRECAPAMTPYWVLSILSSFSRVVFIGFMLWRRRMEDQLSASVLDWREDRGTYSCRPV